MARRKVIVGRKQTIKQGNATVPGFSASVAHGAPISDAGYQKSVTASATAVQSGANVSTAGVPIVRANTAAAPSVTNARGTRTKPRGGTQPNVGTRTTPKTGPAPNLGTRTPATRGSRDPNVGTRTKPGRQATPNTGTRTRPK